MTSRVPVAVSKNATLIIVAAVSFSTALLIPAVNVALPSIGRELAMEAVLLGWVNNGWSLAVAAFLLPAGRLADIYGRRKIFLYGLLLFIVSSFLCIFANSGAMIIACRVTQGISCGVTISTSVAILTSVFPAEERGKVLGINVAAVYSAGSVGPFLGGILTENLGWRSIFLLTTCLGLLVILLVFWKLRGEVTKPLAEKFDFIGAIAFSLLLLMALYGFTLLPTTTGIFLIVLGALAFLGFVWWEGKQDSPLINLGLLRKNTAFVFSNLATLINYSATNTIFFLSSFYLQYIREYSPQQAGSILLVQPVFMVIFSLFAGRLSDRIRPQIVAATGMALSCAGLLFFTFLTAETSLILFIGTLVIFGAGMGFFSGPNTNAVVSSVDKRALGVAVGTQGTARYIGMVLSMGTVMILFSIYIGDAQIIPENYSALLTSMKIGFIIFAALCFGGIFAQLAGIKVRRNNT